MARKCKTKSIHLKDRKNCTFAPQTGVRSPQNQVEPVRTGSSPLCTIQKAEGCKITQEVYGAGTPLTKYQEFSEADNVNAQEQVDGFVIVVQGRSRRGQSIEWQ